MSRMNIEQARSEMRSIIAELESIEQGIRSDFRGIGQDRCANAVNSITNYYRNTVLRQLNSMEQGAISRLLSNN